MKTYKFYALGGLSLETFDDENGFGFRIKKHGNEIMCERDYKVEAEMMEVALQTLSELGEEFRVPTQKYKHKYNLNIHGELHKLIAYCGGPSKYGFKLKKEGKTLAYSTGWIDERELREAILRKLQVYTQNPHIFTPANEMPGYEGP